MIGLLAAALWLPTPALAQLGPDDVVVASSVHLGPGRLHVLDAGGTLRETVAIGRLDGFYLHGPTALAYHVDHGLLVATVAGDFGEHGRLVAFDRRAPHAHEVLAELADLDLFNVAALARDGRGHLFAAESSFHASGCCPYSMRVQELDPELRIRASYDVEVGALPTGIAALAVTGRGERLYYAADAGIRGYDTRSRQALGTIPVPEPVRDLCWLGERDELLAAVQGSRVRRLDAGGNLLATYEFPGESVLELAADRAQTTFWLTTRRQNPPRVLTATGSRFQVFLYRVDVATGALLLRRNLPEEHVGDLAVVDAEHLRRR